MRYGFFDTAKREYVIENVATPVSWTNYLGVNKMAAVISQTAGGYSFYNTPEYHRITRFRPNGVPMDRPGYYTYLRDDDTGEYWSISWQPVGLPLDKARYTCRHGLSYSVFGCDYSGIDASQTLFIPTDDEILLWDVKLENNSGKPRNLSVFTYLEWSFHHIMIDNQNHQMSLYCSGSSYKDGVIEYDLFYEETGYQFFTSSFTPDSYDCTRDTFLGLYHTESNPLALEYGKCANSSQLTGNHCAALHKKLTLAPGESTRLWFMLGQGRHEDGLTAKARYADATAVDTAFDSLRVFWDKKLNKLQINTPNPGMNELINTWTLYQSEINVMFSRFASFIEVGGRTGLGYRDTAQDSMTIPHSNPEKCRARLVELLRGLTSKGYGLHLFDPAWFEPKTGKKPFKSPTVIPAPDKDSIVHGLEDACADDALWLVASIVEYIKETGELSFADEVVTYADGGEGTVYEHMMKILDFSAEQVGPNGICKGLRADWNDCLNLGPGESAMVSELHHWALRHFVELASFLGRPEAQKYAELADRVKAVCEETLWDGSWYLRGITQKGRKIGTHADKEGRVHLESNAWAVLGGVASHDRAVKAMDAVRENLLTDYGLMLNAPSYTVPDEDIGFITRVYPGVKENGAVFSHPNPWAWAAECILGRGTRAMELYDKLSPYNQNDIIETRKCEPYSYCQFIMGRENALHGQANHPFMTGTGGWAYFSATRYMLGIRPGFDSLTVDPCIPAAWKGFFVTRVWRGAEYHITVENPNGVEKGVREILCNDETVARIPVGKPGDTFTIKITMG